ncbi:MAG: TonB-dependent receptor [Flavobacteriaceae bacterium]|nr:TonB-dependent receptor [Flavobacteriaceae bacterium]
MLKNEFFSFFAKLFNLNSRNCKFKGCCKNNKTAVGLSLLAASFCYCQDCDLEFEGQILDLHDNSPISHATIQVIDSDQKVYSGDDGFFKFKNQCSGKINIKISHVKCEDLFNELNLKKSVFKKFFLEHHIESLNEVIVEDSKIRELSSSAKTYLLSELQKDIYSGRGLAKALEQISGVNILTTGNGISKPMIHGMFGSRIGIIYDGIQIENQQWGQDHAPNIDQNAFDNIRLVKGAGVLKYSGDTPGGIVVLENRLPAINDSLYGKSILNSYTNGRGLNFISSWTKSFSNGNYFKVQGTIKRNGDFSAPDYVLSNTGNNENNISFSMGKNKILSQWKTNFSYFSQEIGILKSSHVGNVNDLVFAIESDKPTIINPFDYQVNSPKQINKHYTASTQYSKRNSSNGKLNAKYSWQRNNRREYDVRRGDLKYKPVIDLTLNTHDLISSYKWEKSNWLLDSGVFFQIQDNYSNPDTGTRRLIPDYLKTELGSYFTASLVPSNNFGLAFGFRFGHQNNHIKKYYKNKRWREENYEEKLGAFVINEVLSQKLVEQRLVFNNLSLNTGVKFYITEKLKFSLNLFHTERAPDIAETFSDGLHHSLATIEYGNPFLKSETTQKFVVNFEKEIGNFKFNLSSYYTRGENYIIIEPTGIEYTIRGAFPVWEYRAVSSTIRGFDLDFSLNLNKNFTVRSSSSWVEGFERKSKTPIINMPPFTSTNYIQFSIPKFKSFSMAVSNKITIRQNQFPNHNFETSVVENGKRVRKLVDISSPPNAYHLFSMEFHWGPYPFFSDKISVSLIFDNILDTSYRNYLNRLRFYADEMGRNIMLQIKINH